MTDRDSILQEFQSGFDDAPPPIVETVTHNQNVTPTAFGSGVFMDDDDEPPTRDDEENDDEPVRSPTPLLSDLNSVRNALGPIEDHKPVDDQVDLENMMQSFRRATLSIAIKSDKVLNSVLGGVRLDLIDDATLQRLINEIEAFKAVKMNISTQKLNCHCFVSVMQKILRKLSEKFPEIELDEMDEQLTSISKTIEECNYDMSVIKRINSMDPEDLPSLSISPYKTLANLLMGTVGATVLIAATNFMTKKFCENGQKRKPDDEDRDSKRQKTQ